MRVVSILLLAASLGLAQNTTPRALPLSLKRAVEIALTPEGSARVALAQESIQQAESRVTQARAAFLPTLG
jgi:outer membrane protein TolC